MKWQPIAEAPTCSPEEEQQPEMLVWVADGGNLGKGTVALGRVYESSDGRKVPRAFGYAGDWSITHFCLVEPPK